MLIYDTCESGSLTTSDGGKSRGDLSFIEEQATAIEKLKQATSRTVIVAAGETQAALEGYREHGVFSYALLYIRGTYPGVDQSGLIELFDLIRYVDKQVPELSYKAFHHRQYPQWKLAGSNFPLVRPVPALADIQDTAPQLPAKPTHVVIAPTDVFERAAGRGLQIQKLAPGTLVALVKTNQGWVLVAKEGKEIGFVAQSALMPVQ